MPKTVMPQPAGRHAAPGNHRFEKVVTTLVPSGSTASTMFLWLLPAVALLLALLRS